MFFKRDKLSRYRQPDNSGIFWRLFPYIFGTIFTLAFVIILGQWVLYGWLAYKGVTSVTQDGVQGVLTQLWCGQKKDCKLPSFMNQ